jgi:hypothetical protein
MQNPQNLDDMRVSMPVIIPARGNRCPIPASHSEKATLSPIPEMTISLPLFL